jgi:hypothetical protein
MRTGNPTLNDKTFENFGVYSREAETGRCCTVVVEY